MLIQVIDPVLNPSALSETFITNRLPVKANAVEVLEYLMKLLQGTENKIEDDIDNGQNSPLHIAAQLGHYTCSSVSSEGHWLGQC